MDCDTKKMLEAFIRSLNQLAGLLKQQIKEAEEKKHVKETT